MRIEIWADPVCPWAYIGKRRLDRALAGWDGEPVEVVWRPFRIDPTTPVPSVPHDGSTKEQLLKGLGIPAERDSDSDCGDGDGDGDGQACTPGTAPGEQAPRVAEIAAAEGLGPRWGAAWRASSHDAHRLLVLARRHGGAALQHALAEAVMKAHFTEGRDIGHAETLEQLAAEAGFPEAAALLAAGGGDQEVKELLLIGRARGVATSPTLVVGGRALAGAQSPETVTAFLRDSAGQPERRLPAEVERLRYADALLDRRDPLGALTLLRPLLAEHGDEPGVRLLAARAYFASAQLGRAASLLEEIVAESPDDSFARLLLGRTLTRQGRTAEAAVHLSLAAAMTPEYAS
ncbi:DsbA family protein [Kitasatospora sp. NPDC059646]|uniref:DsbA family protein n=1 Tax=Kitasatospora sp. NPDC059646 TaxID=3346893 RepID=UPI003673D7B8